MSVRIKAYDNILKRWIDGVFTRFGFSWSVEPKDIHQDTIRLCAGIADSTGTAIYDGDIVVYFGYGQTEPFKGRVKYDVSKAMYVLFDGQEYKPLYVIRQYRYVYARAPEINSYLQGVK